MSEKQNMEDKEFEHIVPELRRCTIAAAHACGLDADDTEDVAQDALLRLWALRAELRQGSVQALAYTVAHNMAIDMRRRRRTLPIDGRPLVDDRQTQPDTRLEVADNERWLERKMRALPSTEYHVLRLRQVERRTDSEIAAILGIGAGSVPTLLSRARRKLLASIKNRMK